MRSALVFLALSLPNMALASPTYSSALHVWSAQRSHTAHQRVAVDFFNATTEACELHLAGETISVPAFRSVKLRVPVDARVTVSSEHNSHLAKEVLHASATDEGRTVLVY